MGGPEEEKGGSARMRQREVDFERRLDGKAVRSDMLGWDRHQRSYWWMQTTASVLWVFGPHAERMGFYHTPEQLEQLSACLLDCGLRERGLSQVCDAACICCHVALHAAAFALRTAYTTRLPALPSSCTLSLLCSCACVEDETPAVTLPCSFAGSVSADRLPPAVPARMLHACADRLPPAAPARLLHACRSACTATEHMHRRPLCLQGLSAKFDALHKNLSHPQDAGGMAGLAVTFAEEPEPSHEAAAELDARFTDATKALLRSLLQVCEDCNLSTEQCQELRPIVDAATAESLFEVRALCTGAVSCCFARMVAMCRWGPVPPGLCVLLCMHCPSHALCLTCTQWQETELVST
jgi:Williams-Beuren syndrome DDT (WSD), D-TOX E motif